jgi:hypothetical protein
MRKAIDHSFLTWMLRTTALSLALMMGSAAGLRAETVIGADGAPGAFCDPFLGPSGPDPSCDGGNGESATAGENPAVAYGGNGGIGGIGGSATAVATATAASGDVTASALAVGGNGGAHILSWLGRWRRRQRYEYRDFRRCERLFDGLGGRVSGGGCFFGGLFFGGRGWLRLRLLGRFSRWRCRRRPGRHSVRDRYRRR